VTTPSVSERVAATGFAYVPAFLPFVSSVEAYSVMGDVEAVDGLPPIQALTPKESSSAAPNTYSGNFGLREFPMHTDLAHWAMPPRYIALRCIRGTTLVKTRLIDGRDLVKTIGEAVLRITLMQSRRPLRHGRQLLPLLQQIDAHCDLVRWDSIYLQPSNVFASTVREKVHTFLASATGMDIALADRGDTLILDNWRVLHGRSAVSRPLDGREIHRAYMSNLL
jgi:L-asparagine oxygenase